MSSTSSHGAEVVIAVDVVTPPGGKRDGRAACTKDCKRQDEEDRETGTIERTGDQVRVVLEELWTIIPEVELGEEACKNLAENNASLRLVVRDEASVLNELGHVNIISREAPNFGDELKAVEISSGKQVKCSVHGKEDIRTCTKTR